MKVKLLIIIICLSSSLLAQNKFGQFVVSGGTSYSLFRGVHKLPFRDYEKSFKFTIGQQLHFDLAVVRRMSLGLGVTHQKHVLNITDYQYFRGPAIITEDVTQTIHATSGYFRVLLHALNLYEDTAEELDAYWGVQKSGILFRSTHTSTDAYFYNADDEYSPFITLLAGIRYYPTENFGIHFEAAIPSTYTFSLGLVFRNYGRDKVFRNPFKLF